MAGTRTAKIGQMAPDWQLRGRKVAAWAHLVCGLIWTFTAVRNAYFPGFLHHRNAAGGNIVFPAIIGFVWLGGALGGFAGIRRNPTGKVESHVTTLFGGH
jgi:hypothetical protein